MQFFQQSEATAAQRRWYFACVDDTDGKTPETGLTFTGGELQVSKAGGALANFAGTYTELSDGLYYYEATATELNTLGVVGFKVEKTGVRIVLMQVGQVVPWDPYDASVLGLTGIGAAAITAINAFAHDTGKTLLGLWRRLEMTVSGKATGLHTAGTYNYYRTNGVTVGMTGTHNPAAGTRDQATTTGSD